MPLSRCPDLTASASSIERVHAPSQMGTHLDALNHLHKDGRTYNGHRVADITGPLRHRPSWGPTPCLRS